MANIKSKILILIIATLLTLCVFAENTGIINTSGDTDTVFDSSYVTDSDKDTDNQDDNFESKPDFGNSRDSFDDNKSGESPYG
jgi:hypothetical protein